MQRYWLILIVFLLAACQQEQPPAPTLDTSLGTVAANTVATVEATPEVRQVVTEQPNLIPGTIIPPATQDPMAGTPFERILFKRTGGITGQPLTIEILSDGTFTRNDASGQLTPDEVQRMTDTLDQLNFFGLQGSFTAPGTGADIFEYSITVDRNGASRTIDAQDGLIPSQLMNLINILVQVGMP